MRQISARAAYAVALSVCLGFVAGCGGSGNSTPPPPPAPTITSFVANPATVAVGGSSSLTGVFSNGTGVITPGNLAATSGTAVSVSPATTTTYTLTVTNSAGASVIQTATVTVNSAPTITSFTAAPATITVGGSSSLTGVFAGGTGVITPGNLAATSGTAVSVSPATTTTYTLTVTPTSGAAITQTVTVTVNPAATITSFVANPTTINAGASASLTGVFANGTGVITPGNLAVTSGTAVSVSPATTTTYTLTVTPPAGGTAATQTAIVTVNQPATITSFAASPATIAYGTSANLTGVFANGTGVITPGNLAVTSGTSVSVSPTTTTIYTLTVTPSSGPTVTQTTTVTVTSDATITSFGANPASINAGASSSLTGVFTGGAGVITPGNLPATSGTAVSVSPATTTTYTLTVTPASGPAATQTATVTVVVPPSITSFGASPATITSGTSASVTAVFAGGTGVITPGNLAVTSGKAVNVSPTTTTIYTLTVTPPTGTAVTQTLTVFLQSSVSVDLSSAGPAVTDQLLGMNLATWFDVTSITNAPPIISAFQAAGIKAVRWPGGSWSDAYNWEDNKECGQNYTLPNGFTNFVNNLVIPGGLDVALTADYGTGKNCIGPGDPTEAASWVTNALSLGITVSHMTVGNEEYGNWETDLHTKKNDAATYAAATAGTNGYYALIKAASPSTLVGVAVNPGNSPTWDPIVLANAPYDFVEYHYYPETPGSESDQFLVHQAAQGLTTEINTVKSELKTAGKANTPIYVGEIGATYSDPGKQSWSITQGLYAGQVLGEMMNAGVVRLTWWIGFGNCNGDSGNDSASVYGWQNFGGYNVFADGAGDTGGNDNSACNYGGPMGSMSPTARAFQLFSNVAVNGESALTADTTGDTTNVRAYAATNSGGTALVLFNLNENANAPVTITLSGQSAANTVTVITYDKSLYDMSNPATTDTWAAPTTTNLGAQSLPLTLTLTPWSMNVVLIH
jgi:hypothetical protein